MIQEETQEFSCEKMTRGFMTIPNIIVFDPNLSFLSKFVLGMILSFQFNSQCFASNEYFADQFGVSVRTIERVMKDLEDYKLIERIYDPRKKTRKILAASPEIWKAYSQIRNKRFENLEPLDEDPKEKPILTTNISELRRIWT